MTTPRASAPDGAFYRSIPQAGQQLGVLRALLTCYLACLPIQIETNGAGFRFAPSDIFLILYLLCSASSLKFLRPRVFSGWHVALLFAFGLSTLTAALKTGRVNQYVVLNKDIGAVVLFLTYAVIAGESTSWRDVRSLLRTFILAVAFINTLALISYFGLSPWLANDFFKIVYTGRLSGMLIDPNAYGGLLAVTFAIHAMTYFSSKPIVGGTLGLYIVICLLTGVLYTYSRSSWISIGVIIVVLCAVRPKVGFSFILVIGTGLAGIVVLADQAYVDNMMYFAARPEQVESRVDTIARALPMFLKHPVFGVGLAVFAEDYGTIVHNTPVWFLTEFGLAGFVPLAGLYGWILLRGVRTYRIARAEEKSLVLGLILAHIAILGLSMGIEAFYQRHWWLTMAMVSAVSVLARDEATAAARTASYPGNSREFALAQRGTYTK
jgi:putative inorganic carbon (HCO3(-)) transporter